MQHMADPSANPNRKINLDYLSFSSDPQVRSCQFSPCKQCSSLPPIKTTISSTTTTPSKCCFGQADEHSPQSEYSKSSSSTDLSSISNLWDTSPYSDFGVAGHHSQISSALSASPLSKSEADGCVGFEGASSQSDAALHSPAFDDWMLWDPTEPINTISSPGLCPKREPVSPQLSSIEMRPSSANVDTDTRTFKESPEFNQEALFQSPPSRQHHTSPPSRGLYSTPLSWDTPQPGFDFGIDTNESNNGTVELPKSDIDIGSLFTPLSRYQEERLKAIAMPQLVRSTIDTAEYAISDTGSSPSSPDMASGARKRKFSTATTSSLSSASSRTRLRRDTIVKKEFECRPGQHGEGPVKKTAHNMIEKRYRNNLNDKIAALRDSVPSLRVAAAKMEDSEDRRRSRKGEQEDLQGLAPAHKLNKATVLSKATEYIAHLEQRSRRLERTNEDLKRRVAAFEVLLGQQQQPRRNYDEAHDRRGR